MKLLCVGLNWRTPLSLRETLALDGDKAMHAALELRRNYPQTEFVVLGTCNRTEVYAAWSEPAASPDAEMLFEFLGSRSEARPPKIGDFLYRHEDAAVVEHLFHVAGGLDSLVLGEAQILGQVRTAYQTGVERETAGPHCHALFQKALAVAKRIQTETELSRGRLSIASAAIEHLTGVFERFSDKTVLVIGGGKMAELALVHLAALKPGQLLTINRTNERAEELAVKFGGAARPFAGLLNSLAEADIVLSSTGAELPIVHAAEFQNVMKARKQRLMAILDIAVPRDFDPAIRDFDNVLLWDLDDLEKIRYKTLRAREKELDKALKIVEAESAAFEAAVALQRTGPIIGQLEREFGRITEEELDWLMPQLNGLPDRDREKIRQFAHRMKNKFLHHPKAALRAEAQTGGLQSMVVAFRKLFRLDEP